jgi:hypothetical protein
VRTAGLAVLLVAAPTVAALAAAGSGTRDRLLVATAAGARMSLDAAEVLQPYFSGVER